VITSPDKTWCDNSLDLLPTHRATQGLAGNREQLPQDAMAKATNNFVKIILLLALCTTSPTGKYIFSTHTTRTVPTQVRASAIRVFANLQFSNSIFICFICSLFNDAFPVI
jgi:hypothetical protein